MTNIVNPPFDEQSARAAFYSLLKHWGDVAGITAEADERTQADGTRGYAGEVRDQGQLLWGSGTVWGMDESDVELAQAHALDVARLWACDHLLRMVRGGPLDAPEAHWLSSLVRFRRRPTPDDLNPITLEKEQ